MLKPETDQAAHLSGLLSVLINAVVQITHKYSGTSQFQFHLSQIRVLIFPAVIHGYSGIFDQASLNQLQNDPSVAYIEPDYLADLSYTISPLESSTLPARHRPRKSLACTILGMCASTPGKNDGTGVDIYGLGQRALPSQNQALWFAGLLQESHERLTDPFKRHRYLYREQRFRRAGCTRPLLRVV